MTVEQRQISLAGKPSRYVRTPAFKCKIAASSTLSLGVHSISFTALVAPLSFEHEACPVEIQDYAGVLERQMGLGIVYLA